MQREWKIDSRISSFRFPNSIVSFFYRDREYVSETKTWVHSWISWSYQTSSPLKTFVRTRTELTVFVWRRWNRAYRRAAGRMRKRDREWQRAERGSGDSGTLWQTSRFQTQLQQIPKPVQFRSLPALVSGTPTRTLNNILIFENFRINNKNFTGKCRRIEILRRENAISNALKPEKITKLVRKVESCDEYEKTSGNISKKPMRKIRRLLEWSKKPKWIKTNIKKRKQLENES